MNYSAVLNEIDQYTDLIKSALPFIAEIQNVKAAAIAFQSQYQKVSAGCDLSDVQQARRDGMYLL